jgi:hypothetical protein
VSQPFDPERGVGHAIIPGHAEFEVREEYLNPSTSWEQFETAEHEPVDV